MVARAVERICERGAEPFEMLVVSLSELLVTARAEEDPGL